MPEIHPEVSTIVCSFRLTARNIWKNWRAAHRGPLCILKVEKDQSLGSSCKYLGSFAAGDRLRVFLWEVMRLQQQVGENTDDSFDYNPHHLHQWEAARCGAVSRVPEVAANSHIVLETPLQCVVLVSAVEDLLSMGLLHLLFCLDLPHESPQPPLRLKLCWLLMFESSILSPNQAMPSEQYMLGPEELKLEEFTAERAEYSWYLDIFVHHTIKGLF